MKNKFTKLGTFLARFNTDTKFKNIIGDFIYEHTSLSIKDKIATIFVNEPNINTQLQLLKTEILEKLKKEFNIDDVQIVYSPKKVIKKEIQTKTVDKTEMNVQNIRKDIEKKYENVEDETLKKLLISFATINTVRENIYKEKNYVKCDICKEYFQNFYKENICIMCRNEKDKLKIEYARNKIIENIYMTKEEAKKVFDIPYKIFDIANNKILDNIYILMFEKVEDALENEKINLSKELEEYAIFDTKSKDKNTKQLVKNKIVYKLKNSIKYRFDKDIEIEF